MNATVQFGAFVFQAQACHIFKRPGRAVQINNVGGIPLGNNVIAFNDVRALPRIDSEGDIARYELNPLDNAILTLILNPAGIGIGLNNVTFTRFVGGNNVTYNVRFVNNLIEANNLVNMINGWGKNNNFSAGFSRF